MGLSNEKIYFENDFCRLTDRYYCDRWYNYYDLTAGVAAFLYKQYKINEKNFFKWLTIYENL